LCTPVKADEATTTVAIVDFTNNSGKYLPQVGESASEILSVLLVQTKKFNVVERDKLRSIMEEQGLVGSGLVDNSQSVIQIGKLLGADYIITGSIVSYGERSIRFQGYGINTEKIITEMTVSIKVLNVTNGRIEFASLLSDSVDQGGTGYLETNNNNTKRTLITNVLQSAVNQISENILPEKEVLDTVEVSFISNPQGADLEIDGVYCGNTPLKLQLNPGIHRVTISLAEFNPWDKKINAYEGLEVKAVLERKPEKKEEDD
jgi:curli biogenesis system outer membrane secretion channel CsgG